MSNQEGEENMVRREVDFPKADWDWLIEFFRSQGEIRPRDKISELFQKAAKDFKKRAKEEVLRKKENELRQKQKELDELRKLIQEEKGE